jgi:hypothetical protein
VAEVEVLDEVSEGLPRKVDAEYEDEISVQRSSPFCAGDSLFSGSETTSDAGLAENGAAFFLNSKRRSLELGILC